jgi:hypothetical protein
LNNRTYDQKLVNHATQQKLIVINFLLALSRRGGEEEARAAHK